MNNLQQALPDQHSTVVVGVIIIGFYHLHLQAICEVGEKTL